MVTELGKFLRKLRIDNDELMLDMANKLEVSSAFLSAVENGKKKPPLKWEKEIEKLYSLSKEKIREWEDLFFDVINETSITLEQFTDAGKDFMLEFARKVDRLSEQESKTIRSILLNCKGGMPK